MAKVYRLDVDREILQQFKNNQPVILSILLFDTASEVVELLENPEVFARRTGMYKPGDPFNGFVLERDPADFRSNEEILQDIRSIPDFAVGGLQAYHQTDCQLTLPIPLPKGSVDGDSRPK
jgi:hypothetical protein